MRSLVLLLLIVGLGLSAEIQRKKRSATSYNIVDILNSNKFISLLTTSFLKGYKSPFGSVLKIDSVELEDARAEIAELIVDSRGISLILEDFSFIFKVDFESNFGLVGPVPFYGSVTIYANIISAIYEISYDAESGQLVLVNCEFNLGDLDIKFTIDSPIIQKYLNFAGKAVILKARKAIGEIKICPNIEAMLNTPKFKEMYFTFFPNINQYLSQFL